MGERKVIEGKEEKDDSDRKMIDLKIWDYRGLCSRKSGKKAEEGYREETLG